MQLILVSACLLGEAVRYGGADRLCDHPILRQWLAALVVTAALLRQSGIEVFSEQQFEAANEWRLRLKNTL